MKRLSILFLLTLTACSLSLPQDRELRYLSTPPNIQCSVAKAFDSEVFTDGDWPSPTWWECFGFPELNQLIAEGLQQAPDINEIKARVCKANAEAVIAGSRLYPTTSFDAKDQIAHLSKNGLYRVLNPRIPVNAQLIDVDFNLSYDFDFWGKNRNLLKAACGEKCAQIAEVEQIKLITTTAIARTFFALKLKLYLRDLYQELVRVRAGEKKIQGGLQQKGLSSNLRPFFFEEDYLEAEKLLIGMEKDIEVTAHLLNILVGRSPDVPICLTKELPSLKTALSLPCNVSLDLLVRRPDLMAQIWRAKALAFEVGAAYADFFPNVNLTAFIGLESVTWDRLFRASSATWGVTPAIHLPLFTAGRIQARVCERLCSFDEAVFAYNGLLLDSAAEVVDELSRLRALYAQKSEQEKIVQTATQRYELTKARMCSGLDNQLDLYLIEEEVIKRKIDDINLLFQQYSSIVNLIKALGGGYVAPCRPPLEQCYGR